MRFILWKLICARCKLFTVFNAFSCIRCEIRMSADCIWVCFLWMSFVAVFRRRRRRRRRVGRIVCINQINKFPKNPHWRYQRNENKKLIILTGFSQALCQWNEGNANPIWLEIWFVNKQEFLLPFRTLYNLVKIFRHIILPSAVWFFLQFCFCYFSQELKWLYVYFFRVYLFVLLNFLRRDKIRFAVREAGGNDEKRVPRATP